MPTATKANGVDIDFGTLSGHTGTISVTHVEVWTAATGGVLIASAPIGGATPLPANVSSGSTLKFVAGNLLFYLVGVNGATIGDAVAKALLDAFLGSTSLGPATCYFRLFSVHSDGDSTGGTEFPATGNYVTQVGTAAKTNNPTTWPAATLV